MQWKRCLISSISSRLEVKWEKTEFFCTGLNEAIIMAIEARIGFKRGKLPVRYLGMPLISTKLTSSSDCKALTDKITERIQSWTAKSLSYAGKVQYISSVLISMTKFWCSHFILSKKVIQMANQRCDAFLWKGYSTNAIGAKLAWTEVCKPRRGGGLGIKHLESWNVACCLRNLWLILTRAGSL